MRTDKLCLNTKQRTMPNKSIIVIGSCNMDLVASAPRIPEIGETLTGCDFFMIPGGKGANQAVSAAKLGADVVFVAKLGRDIYGSKLLENLNSEGVNTAYVEQIEGVSSGVALISIDESGRNSIIVVPGANHSLSVEDVIKAENKIASSAVVVCQLEIKMDVVLQAAKSAKKYGIPFILDPAPAVPLSDELLKMADVIKPNELEAAALTGVRVRDKNSAAEAADVLLGRGPNTVIITLGEKGVLLAEADGKEFIESRKVNAVDSTAAGDAFTGALAYAVSEALSMREAAVFAKDVAALSVTKVGAQSSMPNLQEVNNLTRESVE